MNFKDLQFSIGKLTTGAYSHLAKKNPLQKQDTKALSSWIFEERNALYLMRMNGHQHNESNQAFNQWLKDEVNENATNNKDLEDIGDKLLRLLTKQNEVEEAYAAKYQQYRRAIKAIREREDRLSDIREKKRALHGRIGTLKRSNNTKSPKLKEFTKELESLERDTHDTEMEMSDFKRFALQEAFYLRFNAMHEMAEKLSIIAGFGKYIVDLIDIEPTPHGQANRKTYDKGSEAAQILADALVALDGWQPGEGEERPTLAANNPGGADDASTIMGDDFDDDITKGKGRAGGMATSTTLENVESSDSANSDNKKLPAPALPPRPLDKEAEAAAEAAGNNNNNNNMSHIAHTTGDVKTNDEPTNELNLENLDLYGPPPAYSATQDDGLHSPRNSYEPVQLSDAPVPETIPAQPSTSITQSQAQPSAPPMEMRTSQDKYLDESEQEQQQQQQQPYGGNSPANPVHQRLLSASSQLGGFSQSPQPMHQEQVLQQQQQYGYQQQYPAQSPWLHPGSMSSTWSQSTAQPADFYHTNYNQLYRQISRTQRHAPAQIPYSQFQQQYNNQRQQRVDAGGFRIPSSQQPILNTTPSSHQRYSTADEEKQALSERYNQN
ncbi:Eisosome component PIL1-domain-containing protein [Circinella umbellata]|nr:Eisosome component PIL1-domain-containing protein [Circinella umbellata]